MKKSSGFKILAILVVLIVILWFIPSSLISFYLSSKIGSRVDAKVSTSRLLFGNLYFNSLIIHSTKKFDKQIAFKVTDLEYEFDMPTIFEAEKTINLLKASNVEINSITNGSGLNNLSELSDSSHSNLKHSQKRYKIKKAFFGKITFNSYSGKELDDTKEFKDVKVNNPPLCRNLHKVITKSLKEGIFEEMSILGIIDNVLVEALNELT